MNRRVLILTMCLALTVTSALARDTDALTKHVTPQAKMAIEATAKSMDSRTGKPSITTPDSTKMLTREEAKKHFEEKRAKDRAALYDSVGLSEDQKAKAEAVDAKTMSGIGPAVKKLQVESRKYRDLKIKKANFFKIWKQKQAVKTARKNLDKVLINSRKEFIAILTPAQKVKFHTFEVQKRAERDKFKKEHKTSGPNGHKPPKEPGKVGPEGPHAPG